MSVGKLACLIGVLGSLLLGGVNDARAESKVINLSLFPPIQIFDENTDIGGVRLMIYGDNRNVVGLDIGIAGRARGDLTGLQWTWLNLVDGGFKGWQSGTIYNLRSQIRREKSVELILEKAKIKEEKKK